MWIVKCDHLGQEVLRYQGELLRQEADALLVQATFANSTRDKGYVIFRQGDTFMEWHFTARWYNIFELYDALDGAFKGWYCNITRPARLKADEIHADDLALDLFAYPDGRTLVLDEDEFAALGLSSQEQAQAWAALAELKSQAEQGRLPRSA